jgi:hypothetical protein
MLMKLPEILIMLNPLINYGKVSELKNVPVTMSSMNVLHPLHPRLLFY